MIMVGPNFPLPKEMIGPSLFDGLLPDYTTERHMRNRYLQSREEMQRRSFIGLGPSFAVHDMWATEGEGSIQDRTKEHLGYTDKAIALARRLMLNAVKQVQDDGSAPHVVRDAAANNFHHLAAVQEVVPKTEEWASVWKKNVPVA
jgi:hypothetical protein